MDNIVVADKQSAVATQNAWGNITLNSPGVVQMPVAPDQVATVTRRGQDLRVKPAPTRSQAFLSVRWG